LICIANFTVVNAWFVIVLIFHPNQDYNIRGTTNDPHSTYVFSHTGVGVTSGLNTNSAAMIRSHNSSIRENAIGSVLPDKMEHAKPMRPVTPHSTAPSSMYPRETSSPLPAQRKNSEQFSLSSVSTPGNASYPDTHPFVQEPNTGFYPAPPTNDLRPTLSQAAGVRFDGAKKYRNDKMIEMSENAVYRQAQEWEAEAAARLGRTGSPNTWLRQAPTSPADKV
jgi:hypothetical protein